MTRHDFTSTLILLAALTGGCGHRPYPTPTRNDLTSADVSAAYKGRDWMKCASLSEAVGERGRADAADSLYIGATCFALAGLKDQAFSRLDRTINAGWWDVEQMTTDPDFTSLHADPRWNETVDRVRANAPHEPALRVELLAMYDDDQVARKAWIADSASEAAKARVAGVDAKHLARLKAIIGAHGWPGYKLVGREGAQAAWLLVQHTDSDRAFQKSCLELLQSAVAARDADAAHYAYLYDRLAVGEQRKQRYGTQFRGDSPFPIEEPESVDARRAAVGLGTMAAYREEMRAAYGPKASK